ncbi:hypothetical protein EJ08DRAFT_660099 [Tothia fuscella]|uniref:Uncharacterized protein n=1 Tax=Tothia fuscella TaxID=1048955 RepID=A0A9P4NTK7_9PEZI|nr:hypothetical protein EJ08DRAFT_660099 [Tothia fuscella]
MAQPYGIGWDSDDIEIPEEDWNPFTELSKDTRALDIIVKQAHKLRVESKILEKSIANHVFSHLPPNVQNRTWTWVRRWQTFCEHALGCSPSTTPTPEALHRFLLVSPSVINGRQKIDGTTAPSKSSVSIGFSHVLAWVIARFPDFKVTPSLRLRASIAKSMLSANGSITNSPSRYRQSVGQETVKHINQVKLQDSLRKGCGNWDLVIQDCLLLATLSATGARAGDITRSDGYTDNETLRWSDCWIDVEIHLNTQSPTFRGTFSLCRKGAKKDHDRPFNQVAVDAVAHQENQHICMVSLLIAHALRTGAVAATSIDQLVSKTLAQPRPRIVWSHPGRSVFSRRKSSDVPNLDIENALQGTGACEIVKSLSRQAGITTSITPHDFRRGVAREISHISNVQPDYDSAAAVLGHSNSVKESGVTAKYVGRAVNTAVNQRLRNQQFAGTIDPDLLLSTVPFKPTRATVAALKRFLHKKHPLLSEEQLKQELNPPSKRVKVKSDMHAEELKVWRDQAVTAKRRGPVVSFIGSDNNLHGGKDSNAARYIAQTSSFLRHLPVSQTHTLTSKGGGLVNISVPSIPTASAALSLTSSAHPLHHNQTTAFTTGSQFSPVALAPSPQAYQVHHDGEYPIPNPHAYMTTPYPTQLQTPTSFLATPTQSYSSFRTVPPNYYLSSTDLAGSIPEPVYTSFTHIARPPPLDTSLGSKAVEDPTPAYSVLNHTLPSLNTTPADTGFSTSQSTLRPQESLDDTEGDGSNIADLIGSLLSADDITDSNDIELLIESLEMQSELGVPEWRYMSPMMFIDWLAKINVHLRRKWRSNHTHANLDELNSYSKDKATYFVYHCHIPGCATVAYFHEAILSHVQNEHLGNGRRPPQAVTAMAPNTYDKVKFRAPVTYDKIKFRAPKTLPAQFQFVEPVVVNTRIAPMETKKFEFKVFTA